jgi:hypothetical protein
MKHLNEKQAYLAMCKFLESYQSRTGSADIAALLGDVQVGLFQDGDPADPASWPDWLMAVKQVLDAQDESLQ